MSTPATSARSDQEASGLRRVSRSDPRHPALLVVNRHQQSRQDLSITKQGEEVTTDPTALGALRQRVRTLESQLRTNVRERDRYQRVADMNQKQIDEAAAEINSINSAIELLEAATEYAGDRQEET